MSIVPPEVERVRTLCRSLADKDKSWVSVKSGSFCFYTDHDDRHDGFAYSIYSEGRQMANNLGSWLSELDGLDSCHTYSEFVEHLETIVGTWLPHYEERYELHKKHVKMKCGEQGAPHVWEVNLALSLWEEQMTMLRNLPKLINMFKRSNNYRAENGLPLESQGTQTSIIAHAGATVSTSTVNGDGNIVMQGKNNSLSIASKEDLFSQLRALGIREFEIEALEAAMNEDDHARGKDVPPTEIGPSVKRWLGDITFKLAQQITAVANGVSGSLIANMISEYFSLL